MSTKRTPAGIYEAMTEAGFTNIRETKFGIEYSEPSWSDPEIQRMKSWVRANYLAFAAYLRDLPRPAERNRSREREDQKRE